jgi:hypothetical protein
VECNGDDAPAGAAPAPRRFHLRAGFSAFGTELSFIGGPDSSMERRAVTAGLSYRYSDKITLQASLGATLGGALMYDRERYSFDPGWLASASVSWKMVGEKRNDSFLLVGLAFAASGGPTKDVKGIAESMYAADFRISLIGGKTFYDVLSPYLVVRAFGGPILWEHKGEPLIGGDKYHFQVGAGVVAALPGHFDVFAEGIPLGERASVVGVGYSF